METQTTGISDGKDEGDEEQEDEDNDDDEDNIKIAELQKVQTWRIIARRR